MTRHEAYLVTGMIAMAFWFVAFPLFAIFYFTTVRRLEKNPETRMRLGAQPSLRAYVVFVAMAMCRRRDLVQKLEGSLVAGLFPDGNAIQRHTSRGEQRLGRVCVALLVLGFPFFAASWAIDRWGYAQGIAAALGALLFWWFLIYGAPDAMAALADARRRKESNTVRPERPTGGRPRNALRARSRRHGVRSRRMTPPPRRSAAR